MRSASKAAKLRAKRTGRPRKSHAERYANGRIKPAWSQDNKQRESAETEKEVMGVALAARAKVFAEGTAPEILKSPFAGYVLGRIFLDGKINEAQREAGDEFAIAMCRYYGLTGVPFPSARAQSIGGVRGDDGDVSESRAEAARKATNRMMHLSGVLMRCTDGPQVRTTVVNVALMDYDNLRGMPDAQMALLRCGLNALIYDKGLQTFGKSHSCK